MDYKSKEVKKTLLLISFGVILFWGLNNIKFIFEIISRVMTILTPFLLGIGIAFIFNGPMVAIENFIFGKNGSLKKIPKKIKR